MTTDLNQIFIPPDNPEMSIWRYMDFPKFISMLHLKSLYFARSDKFSDRHEGSISKSTQDALYNALLSTVGENRAKETLENSSALVQLVKAWIFINSWHMSENESMAMWKVYSGSEKAIAIRSTYNKLKACLPADINLGVVRYMDYEKQAMPRGNVFHYFTRKRIAFDFERELRAMVTGEFPMSVDQLIAIPAGKLIPVELNKLITSVYVSPESQGWFKDAVTDVVEKYGLACPVVKSSIDSEPFFGIS
jgi:hypothetical protein